jgi:hypothetical protein
MEQELKKIQSTLIYNQKRAELKTMQVVEEELFKLEQRLKREHEDVIRAIQVEKYRK